MRITFRPTVAEDLPQVIDVPLPHRIRAITAVIWDDCQQEERILGVGGIGYRPDGTVIGFAALKPEMKKYRAAMHRAGLAGMAMFEASGVPCVIAEAEEDNPAAARWLERLGFERREIGGVAAFVWERPSNVE